MVLLRIVCRIMIVITILSVSCKKEGISIKEFLRPVDRMPNEKRETKPPGAILSMDKFLGIYNFFNTSEDFKNNIFKIILKTDENRYWV